MSKKIDKLRGNTSVPRMTVYGNTSNGNLKHLLFWGLWQFHRVKRLENLVNKNSNGWAKNIIPLPFLLYRVRHKLMMEPKKNVNVLVKNWHLCQKLKVWPNTEILVKKRKFLSTIKSLVNNDFFNIRQKFKY